MNIIECTIQMKHETQAHYERLSDSVIDKDLKRLFSLLAAAEREHVAKLGNLMKSMGKFDVDNFYSLDEKVCVYNPHTDLSYLAESLKNNSDAYLSVVREEEGTIEFFDHLSDQAENERLKRICHILADKEREHLEMLENIYSFVEEPRTYLEWGEFSNLKSL